MCEQTAEELKFQTPTHGGCTITMEGYKTDRKKFSNLLSTISKFWVTTNWKQRYIQSIMKTQLTYRLGAEAEVAAGLGTEVAAGPGAKVVAGPGAEVAAGPGAEVVAGPGAGGGSPVLSAL